MGFQLGQSTQFPRGIVHAVPEAMRPEQGLAATENAARLEAFFADRATRQTGFGGADGMYSMPLPGGRTLLSLGDTVTGGRIGPVRMKGNRFNFIRNSQALFDGDTFKVGIPPLWKRVLGRSEWLKPETNGVVADRLKEWYWPADMTQTDEGAQLILNRFASTGPDGRWDWAPVKTEIATLDPETLNLKHLRTVNTTRDVIWGAALLEHNEHTYIYGAASQGQGKEPALVIARASNQDISSGWEYLGEGGSWSGDASTAARLPVPVASQFSAVAAKDGGVDLIVQHGFYAQLEVVHGDAPAGPFHTDQSKKVNLPEVGDPRFISGALAHPELSDDSRLVMSTNQNRFGGLGTHASDYRPRWFTIPQPDQLQDGERVERYGA
jgi:hypothetical protein